MSNWGEDYGHKDLIRISEKIYECKEKKKVLETELTEVKFRYQYIPKRKHMVFHQAIFQMFFIIPISIFICSTLFSFWIFLDGFLFYLDVRMIIKETKLLYLLVISMDTPFMIQYAEEHNLNSFQRQQGDCLKRMSLIELQMLELDKEITNLELKRKEAIAENEKREDTLRKKGILFDENPNKDVVKPKFALKEESVGTQDVAILDELYSKEIVYLNQYVSKLKEELQRIDTQIVETDEKFERIIKQIIFVVIIFSLAILIENQMTGMASIVIGVIFLVASTGFIFYADAKYKKPILLYLIEHDSFLTSEYAFCNNIMPIKNKRAEIKEKIDTYDKELQDIKDKKAKLDNN